MKDKHFVKHFNPQACTANSDTSDFTYAPSTLFAFPKLASKLFVYQEVMAVLNVPNGVSKFFLQPDLQKSTEYTG